MCNCMAQSSGEAWCRYNLPFHLFQENQLSNLDGLGIVILVRVSKCISEFILYSIKKTFLRQNTKFNNYIYSQRECMKLPFIVLCGSNQVQNMH